MKWFAKINRGAIVTTLVLVCVAGYLISLNVAQNNEKGAIKEICEKYIQVEVKYKTLEEKYRGDGVSISKEELEKYIAQMETEIKSFYPPNFDYRFLESKKTSLKNQSKGIGVIKKYEKELQKIKSYSFNGKSVNVKLEVATTLEGEMAESKSETTAMSTITEVTNDEINLTKIDNKWYVTSAEISNPINKGQIRINY